MSPQLFLKVSKYNYLKHRISVLSLVCKRSTTFIFFLFNFFFPLFFPLFFSFMPFPIPLPEISFFPLYSKHIFCFHALYYLCAYLFYDGLATPLWFILNQLVVNWSALGLTYFLASTNTYRHKEEPQQKTTIWSNIRFNL